MALPPTVVDEFAHLPERLAAAREAVADSAARLELERRTRNGVIVEAVDAGLPQQYVADCAGVSQPHVVRVLAGSDE